MIEVICFIGSVALLNFSYGPVRDHLIDHTDSFKQLNEKRKDYVIKNLLKATYLAFLCLVTICCFGPYWLYGIWPNWLLKSLASLYVSNDAVGLWRVDGLKTSTRLHHMTTMLFLLVAWTLDFQTSKLAKLMFLYTFSSALTFPVNAYLGLRLCYDQSFDALLQLAFYSYAGMSSLNWILQLAYYESSLWSYYVFILFVVYDDLVLLTWLRDQLSEMTRHG